MKQDLMRFRLHGGMMHFTKMSLALANKVNSHRWMEKEPGTCRVVGFDYSGEAGSPATAAITVRHRPHGWGLRAADKKADGTFLDGQGQPLAEGQEKVILEFESLHQVDFNDFDFGDIIPDENSLTEH